MIFNAPIPGESLTREPGNAPWEQPPLFNTAEEALGFYLEKFDDEESLDEVLFALEQKFPLSILVDSFTSYGVMEGYHSFDVKMIISPILHEYIKTLAETVGVEVVESGDPTKEERVAERDKKRMAILIQRSLEEDGEPEQPSQENVQEASELLENQTPPTEDKPVGGLVPRMM
jgi:hypothetical protein